MEARDFRYFLAVAEELHFGRAAERLSIAAPALSRAVRRAESELGVELFVRDTHGVRLTDAGEKLVGGARDALASLDEALAVTHEAGGLNELTGVLDVGVNPFLRHGLGPAIFERFAVICPAVRLTRREQFSGPLMEELRIRRIDVALDFCPARAYGFIYEPICDADLIVLISSEHRLAARASVDLFDLRDEPFLLPSAAAAPAMRMYLSRLSATAGFKPNFALREIDHDEQMDAIKEGAGVMLVSRFFLEAVPSGVTLLELDLPARLEFELVRRDEHPPPALARFIDAAHYVGSQETLDLKCFS